RTSYHPELHSFPTRRSSDLIKQNVVKEVATDAPAEEKPKRSRQPKAVEEAPAENVQNQTSNDVGDGELSVNELKRLQQEAEALVDRKSTRLNSSHVKISYAV